MQIDALLLPQSNSLFALVHKPQRNVMRIDVRKSGVYFCFEYKRAAE